MTTQWKNNTSYPIIGFSILYIDENEQTQEGVFNGFEGDNDYTRWIIRQSTSDGMVKFIEYTPKDWKYKDFDLDSKQIVPASSNDIVSACIQLKIQINWYDEPASDPVYLINGKSYDHIPQRISIDNNAYEFGVDDDHPINDDNIIVTYHHIGRLEQ